MPPATPSRSASAHSRPRVEVVVLVVVSLVLGIALLAVGVGVALAATSSGPGGGAPDSATAAAVSGEGPDVRTTALDSAQIRDFTNRLAGAAELARQHRQADADLQAFAAASEMAAAAQAFDDARVRLGLPPDSYWDRMAMCETGGNWHMTGSRYSGGVGFANSTWVAFGGREFAPNAGQASREQQIIVANRVATQGYGGAGPAGYSAWGCAARIGRP